MYLLDTDHMSVLRYGGAEALRLTLRLSAIPDDELVSCIVVYEEQMRGWLEKAAKAQSGVGYMNAYTSLANNLTLYCGMTLLPFDAPAAAQFDALKTARINIGTQDLKIASIALVNDATLLTRNTRHFEKVPLLKFDDWTS
jgi:tRNA(fMet)-specific endonuclease VapC